MPYAEEIFFAHALPVWETGKETEMNYSLLFRAVVPAAKGAVLRMAGHTRYTLRVNGRFVAAGPARAGHGWYRVDEFSLDGLLTEEQNVVAILVAGYNVNSFAYVEAPSFLCCEIMAGETLLAATGVQGFGAVRYTQRVQRVQRYSFQRPFVESYRFDAHYDDAATCPDWKGDTVPLTVTAGGRFLARSVPYAAYDFVPVCESVERGGLQCAAPQKPYDNCAVYGISGKLHGFRVEALEELTVATAQAWHPDHADTAVLPGADADVAADGYATFRLPKNLSGFLEMTVTPETDVTLMVTFDEIITGGEVDFIRMDCSNVVIWRLAGGHSYTLRSFEPYTLQYLNVIALGGGAAVRGVGLRRFDFPAALLTGARPMPTARLQAIYDAAVESFRQNTLDIYMDCPSRERAGWLCDSFFTSRVEYALTGRSTVERSFLQNFLLPDHFDFIPAGMLPQCYPSDHNDGAYIYNWAMWYVLELEEYLHRTGDAALIEAARPRMEALRDYLRSFENADGLLEKLPIGVFVEWSHANWLGQDINYPTNMLYARAKEALAALYGDESLAAEAAALKETIRRQSFTGSFFCDNAVYNEEGVAVLSGEVTETCQYYAFFTGTATPESYPQLWRTLVEEFGPHRAAQGLYPEVWPSNAFIGNYLRLELLYRAGLTDKVLENIDGYFYYMAERTGTLWENIDECASCNHGFASHVAYWLNGIFG